MAFTRTTKLIELLKARLESLPLVEGDTNGGERLFQRVGVFGANRLKQALAATFASEQRVAFIVPVGDNHGSDRGRLVLTSERTTSLVVLMADRVMDKTSAAAVIGGPHSIGILDMKDRVIENLTEVPFAEISDLCYAPAKGEPLILQDAGSGSTGSGDLGRECWAQEFSTYAGLIHQNIP